MMSMPPTHSAGAVISMPALMPDLILSGQPALPTADPKFESLWLQVHDMTVAQLQQDLDGHHDRDAVGLKVGSLTSTWFSSWCSQTACCVAVHRTQCT